MFVVMLTLRHSHGRLRVNDEDFLARNQLGIRPRRSRQAGAIKTTCGAIRGRHSAPTLPVRSLLTELTIRDHVGLSVQRRRPLRGVVEQRVSVLVHGR